MSFTSEVKEELCRVPAMCSHCDRALLASLVRAEGSLLLSGGGRCRIELATDSPSVARTVVRLTHEIYHLHTESTVRRSVLHKTPNYFILIPDQPALRDALFDMGIMDANGLVPGIQDRLVEKRCCSAAYLRGFFLGSGFVSSPKGDFHFEMIVENEELAQDLVELMSARGISARIMQRRNSFVVYLKSGTAISEFLALVGAHQCALAMENERVIKSVRNDVNRLVNAEIANQQKASHASMEQIMQIRFVVNAYGMEKLSAGLKEFIRLRVANPDATIKELGQLANPPLSKSAVYHRIRRIEQMAIEAGYEPNSGQT